MKKAWRGQRRLRASRDPRRTVNRIVWLAAQAEERDDARQVLHDALLEANDVTMPLVWRRQLGGFGFAGMVPIRTLAEDYAWHVLAAERVADSSGDKRVIVFTRRLMALPGESPFSYMRQSYATERLPAGNVVVYTTQAGAWGKLTP